MSHRQNLVTTLILLSLAFSAVDSYGSYYDSYGNYYDATYSYYDYYGNYYDSYGNYYSSNNYYYGSSYTYDYYTGNYYDSYGNYYDSYGNYYTNSGYYSYYDSYGNYYDNYGNYYPSYSYGNYYDTYGNYYYDSYGYYYDTYGYYYDTYGNYYDPYGNYYEKSEKSNGSNYVPVYIALAVVLPICFVVFLIFCIVFSYKRYALRHRMKSQKTTVAPDNVIPTFERVKSIDETHIPIQGRKIEAREMRYVQPYSAQLVCSVCLDTIQNNLTYSNCGHQFHYGCHKQIKDSNGVCPLCRHSV